jgi:hypothetical protein
VPANSDTLPADPAPYVRLAPSDNVVVLTRHVERAEHIPGLSGGVWLVATHLEAGNKLAAVPIAAGERVFKVGVPIGTATAAIAPGEHVHSHNLRSDYIPIEAEGTRGAGEH